MSIFQKIQELNGLKAGVNALISFIQDESIYNNHELSLAKQNMIKITTLFWYTYWLVLAFHCQICIKFSSNFLDAPTQSFPHMQDFLLAIALSHSVTCSKLQKSQCCRCESKGAAWFMLTVSQIRIYFFQNMGMDQAA